MTLENFIKDFVARNTLIRLWYRIKAGHILVEEFPQRMEWEVTKPQSLQTDTKWHKSKIDYSQREVLYVTDILTDEYPEAVNIVIQEAGSVLVG